MKLLVIAFDGMGYESLISQFLDGDMPFFSGLHETGVYGYYESVYKMTLPSWTSIYTGVKKERHLVSQNINSLLTGPYYPKYWDLLGSWGYTQGVFHMPLTYPPSHVNGWMVSGFPSPDKEMMKTAESTFQEQPMYCFPSSLSNHLENYSRTIDDLRFTQDEDKKQNMFNILDSVLESTRKNLTALEQLYVKYPIDCLSVGYQFPDFIGHQLEELQGTRSYKEVCRRLCRTIDYVAGTLVYRFRAKHYVICADHGFYSKKGEHASDASLFVGGNKIRNMQVPEGLHEWDLMPTILKLCGVDAPHNIDGRAFTMFTNELGNNEKKSMQIKMEKLGYM